MHSTIAAAVVAVAVQGAYAGWDVNANKYSSPNNCNNQCSPEQGSGYNFGDLPSGSFSSYGSNSFGGFSCGSSHYSKRDLGSDKCITGEISAGSGPSMSCNSDEDQFSIDHMHISSSEDTDVHCIYQMPGGSECHQTVHCPASGASISNNQCGGATAVSFQQPTQYLSLIHI